MALFRRSFSRKLPDRLLEISERIYVFDSCLSTSVMNETEHASYLSGIVAGLHTCHPGASFMVFNFQEGDQSRHLSDILTQYDMTVVDYPRHYEGYPLLPLEMIHYFLRSSESWLSLEGQRNVILMHCEQGGWPVLAFMLAGLLLYRKQYTGEQKTLEMVYKQAPKELFSVFSPINPRPSQLRYLHYITSRSSGSDWQPADASLVVDYIIMRNIPLFEGARGCRPVVRVYGLEPSVSNADRSPRLLFSSLMTEEPARHYSEEECKFIKLDMDCKVQADVFLECIHLHDDLVLEELMFRVMFHTGFIQSDIWTLTSGEIDVPWNAAFKNPKDFKAEVLFSNADEVPPNITREILVDEAYDSESEFFEVEEIFTPSAETHDTKRDFNTIIAQETSSSETIKDCTLHNGSPIWDLQTESDLITLKHITLESESDTASASKNVDVVNQSHELDVKVEVDPKSVTRKKKKKNRWQEAAAKTMIQQRVIAQWVPRQKDEPTKPKTPVYKWVPKGAPSGGD